MIALGRYGALTAKVRALYGKRLLHEDFEKMAGMSNVGQVAGFLRGHPGWQKALASVPQGNLSRGDLEEALRVQLRAEYLSLFYFISVMGKRSLIKYIKFMAYKMDLELILAALRRLSLQRGELRPKLQSDVLKEGSTVDIAGIENAKNFTELLKSVEGSIYHAPLQAMK